MIDTEKEYLIDFTCITVFHSKWGAQIRNNYKEFYTWKSAKEATQKMFRIYADMWPNRSVKLNSVTLIW